MIATGSVFPIGVIHFDAVALPENPNRSTHSWESKRAPNYRRFS